MLLVEGGCCLAEALGCGPQLLLATPAVLKSMPRQPELAPATTAPGPRGSARERLVRALIGLIVVYQRDISPKRPPCCRFSPTCSHYAVEALERHGLRRGLALSARRLLRCRPGARGGEDPVPA
jgi:putative membrane protein insertion efficiency factor